MLLVSSTMSRRDDLGGLSARVVRSQEAIDLALRKTESPVDAALQLGDDTGLYEPKTFLFNAPDYRGNDGGPLIDAGGRVVGVVTRAVRARAAHVAMSVGAIHAFKIEVQP